MAEIVVLAAHPALQMSRVTRELVAAARQLDPARVALRDLYALYPDYWIDAAAEQTVLAAARLVVWLHPIHWYSMPPLMKLWLDEVLTFGWAYGPGGHALHGKDLWLVASTGGGEDAYRPGGSHQRAFADFLPPYEQTAALVGMRWLPPLLLHGAHRVDAAALQRHAALFAQRLQQHLLTPAPRATGPVPALEVAADERPPASRR